MPDSVVMTSREKEHRRNQAAAAEVTTPTSPSPSTSSSVREECESRSITYGTPRSLFSSTFLFFPKEEKTQARKWVAGAGRKEAAGATLCPFPRCMHVHSRPGRRAFFLSFFLSLSHYTYIHIYTHTRARGYYRRRPRHRAPRPIMPLWEKTAPHNKAKQQRALLLAFRLARRPHGSRLMQTGTMPSEEKSRPLYPSALLPRLLSSFVYRPRWPWPVGWIFYFTMTAKRILKVAHVW